MFQYNFKLELDKHLTKIAMKRNAHAEANIFDAVTLIRPDTITRGIESAISSGNWSLKRFKMER